ncbi:MAG: hypothetical protein ACTSRU_15130, partial [Candidatus Hodarchaeales archaeon]
QGFKCSFNEKGADIVATKGGFKKKKYYVIIGANEFDADLALYRLRDERANKILFLQDGNPENLKTSGKRLQIVKNVNDIIIN